MKLENAKEELITKEDTDTLIPHVRLGSSPAAGIRPIDLLIHNCILPVAEVFQRLRSAIGRSFPDAGRDQERNRGDELRKIVCELLGYADNMEDGRFTDIRNQLLEVKLQTSLTIDLGLVCPNSEEPLDALEIEGTQIRPCDVRYALFYGTTDGTTVTLTHFYLTTGDNFFKRFTQFQGNTLNRKLQIRLPSDFFDR